MLAEPPSQRMGIAIRRVKAPAGQAQLTYVATAPGYLEISVRQGSRRVAPLWRGEAQEGLSKVPLPRMPPDDYTLTVRATAANGTRDSDQLGVVLGGRLPISVAAWAIKANQCDDGCEDAPDTTEQLGRCRRFGRTRVDCRIDTRETNICLGVGSAVLRRSGLVWTRGYRCPMRRRPGRFSSFSAAPLL
jgi:hypothetical protein